MTRRILLPLFAIAFAFALGSGGAVSTANAAPMSTPLLQSQLQTSIETGDYLTEVRKKKRWGKRRSYRRYKKRRRGSNAGAFAFGLFLGHALTAPRYYSPRRSSGRCSYWANRCADNWGYRTNSYYGCLRYHGCR